MRAIYNSYLFILIPFIILCIIKGVAGKWEDIILSTDWSVASFIMFAQRLGEMMSSISSLKKNINPDVLTTYIIKIIFVGLMPAVYVYFLMTTSPSLAIGKWQVVIFVYATWRYLVDGRKIQMIKSAG